jgi:hypothetical protein
MTEKKSQNIHEAMLKFHKEFTGAQKTGVNPHFKSEHFSLDDIVRATTPILNKCGLYVIHQVVEGCPETSVVNRNGDSLKSSIRMKDTPNPQVDGSNMTYFKRYNSCGLFNIAEADDDGNLGANAAEHEVAKTKREPQEKATKEQRAAMDDYLTTFEEGLPATQRAYTQLKSYLGNDQLTRNDAMGILNNLKEYQA